MIKQTLDAVVVGAGFAGMYMVHRLVQLGLDTRAFDIADDFGGTWYWNRYPGARCDIESMQYSFSFSEELEREWCWSEIYASQPEILRYIHFVAQKLNLRKNFTFNTAVTSLHYDEKRKRWEVTLSSGEVLYSRFVIMATGILSVPQMPSIDGIDKFQGDLLHTGRWPHDEIDFSGKRVAVVGTGSSSIQLVPIIAQEALELLVFQRTANFVVPLGNEPVTHSYDVAWKQNYPMYRDRARKMRTAVMIPYPPGKVSATSVSEQERSEEYAKRWRKGGVSFLQSYTDLLTSSEANESAASFVRGKIAEIVVNPDVASKLMPTSHPIGTKRLCFDNGYFECFNRNNVSLIDANHSRISSFLSDGVVLSDGQIIKLDSVVFATGYEAFTGPMLKVNIEGVGGITLRQSWVDVPKAYLGLMVAGFPNMFLVNGPGSASALGNVMRSIEHHVDWIANCISWLQACRFDTIVATESAQDQWLHHIQEIANNTLMANVRSWWNGANIEGKPIRVMAFAGGLPTYFARADQVAENYYEGFIIN